MTTQQAKEIVKSVHPQAVLSKWITGYAVFVAPGSQTRLGTARTQPSDAWITAARTVKADK